MKKVARRLMFDYWTHYQSALDSVYSDGEYNLGDDDCDEADEIINESHPALEDMIDEINNDENFKHYEFQIDEKGIWLLSNTSAKIREEIKEYFDDMWDNL